MKLSWFSVTRWLLFLTPFTVVIVTTSTLFPFIVGKYIFFRTVVALAVVAFSLGVLLAPDEAARHLHRLKHLLRQPLIIAIVVFVLVFVVAGLFGVNSWQSFFSNFERGEGGLQMLTLLAYALLLATLFQEKKDWKLFFAITAVAAVGVVLYGVAAGVKYVDAEVFTGQAPDGEAVKQLTGKGGSWYALLKGFIGPPFSQDGYRFQGSIGNPAYVATYLTFAIFFVVWLLLQSTRRSQKTLISALLAVFLSFFVLAATRGAFLGILAGIGTFLLGLGFSYRKWRKWVAALLFVAVLGVGGLIFFNDHSAVEALPFSRLFDISIAEKTLQDRIIMWGIAWEAWQDRPLLGYGPENFIYAFDRYFDPAYYTPGQQFGAWFDRAHNVFFDYLVTTGVLGLAAYVAIFVALFQLIIRGKTGQAISGKAEGALFLALPIAYLVQGLVLFDVLVVYVPLFAFLAFAQWRYGEVVRNDQTPNNK